MTNQASEDEQKVGYIKVTLNYAPKTNGKKFKEWCKDSGFTYIGGGRRAWSSSLSTYLRDADGIAYADGEPFLFYEEDLIDIQSIIRTEKLKLLAEVRERVVGEHKPKTRGLTQNPNNAAYWTKASQAEFDLIEQQLNNLDKLEAEL